MLDRITSNEPQLRLAAFIGVFVFMALWELVASRRELSQSKGRRWFANLGISLLDSVTVRLVFPTAEIGVALLAAREGWGLLNHYEAAPAIAVLVTVLVCDLTIYLQHVLFHAVPILWRLHMVHHSDQDFDVSTGIRFHPIEILLSVVIKFAVIVALGASPAGVFLFAVLLNATSMFNHGNVRLPGAIDRVLRWIVVTPDMHRVHHSVEVNETNSNFGFNLPWWDRLFGTYRAQPKAGHESMLLGVDALRQPDPRDLPKLLALPFASRGGRYALPHRSRADEKTGQPDPREGPL